MPVGRELRRLLSNAVSCRISRLPSCERLYPSVSNLRMSSVTASFNPNCKQLWTCTRAEVEEEKLIKVIKRRKSWNAPPDPTSPPKVKQAYTIKRLNKENKDLFGDLLESKQEKVKRTKNGLKLAKGKTEKIKKEDGMKTESLLVEGDKDDFNQLEMTKESGKKRKESQKEKLPRAESIRLEHAGMSINKNPKRVDVGEDNMMTGRSSSGVTLKAHKGAEIEWSLRAAPTKMKLIELSPSSSSATNELCNSMDAPVDIEGVQDEIISLRYPSIVSSTSPKLPSVTKILSATMPEEQARILKRWEEKMIAQMGEEGFRQYKEGILTNGKLLHGNIETFLRGTPSDEISVAERNQGHWNSLSGILESIDHVSVLESHVAHPQHGYCGMIDCVAEFRNRLVLIDWKTSQKPKPSISMTYDTPLQIAAYVGAINDDTRYSLKVDCGLIVVAYEDGSSCQTFLLGQKELDRYWKLWMKRLELYRQMNPALST